MKILILGGYGVFGGRLAELLSDISDLEIFICGRNLQHAEKFCEEYVGNASVKPMRLDRTDIVDALGDIQPDLVVDASGPFQKYGQNCYLVPEACIAAGIDYVDFADAADFVFGISELNEQAKNNGVFVLTGVSSFPVLTAAVVREMAEDTEIISIEGGIAPSPYAGVGMNVMRAVVGYAGEPIKILRNGVQTEAMGLAETMRFTIGPPGKLPLRNTLFSLVDVPDLQVIPPNYKALRDIWMGAGPKPEFLHRILNLLARLRANYTLPSLVPLSALFYWILNLMRTGEHRGGMFVRTIGIRNGEEIEKSWHLLAEGDDGPYIPSMAIEIIIRKLLEKQRPEAGARPATEALELHEYEPFFQNHAIHTGFRENTHSDDPLYRQILGTAFDALPSRIKQIHAGTEARRWSGSAKITRGKGFIANLIASIIGFPPESEKTLVSVDFSPEPDGEKWTRNFGGKIFSSIQKAGTGKNELLLIEGFGKIDVALALIIDGSKLRLIPRSWAFWGIPMPKFLLPTGDSYETEKEGSFHFDVEIATPLIGLIVAYKGSLEPDA